MKIKLSRIEWEKVGKRAGWLSSSSTQSFNRNAQMLSRFETLELGPTPAGEDCSQVGYSNNIELNNIEIVTFKNQCMRLFPNIPNDARYTKVRNEHEFGTYYELGIKFNEENEEAVNYAYNVESHIPESWDETAKSELTQKGYFKLLEQNKLERSPKSINPNGLT